MLTVAIQAGGQSRRMGTDKALMPFLGQPLIRRVVTRLAPIADQIIITTNQPENYTFLNIQLYSDLRPDRGALGGLYTALMQASQPLVAVLACDMPFVSPQLLAYQAQVLQNESADMVIPLLPGGYEPLHAVYRRSSCLPAVEWALDHDQWKLISWFSQVKVRTLTPEECLAQDPSGRAFSNVNTPQELAEAQAAAQHEAD